MSDEPKLSEMRLIRRLRSLQSGAHLCIIEVDAGGAYCISFIGTGKLEKIRRFTDNIERENPAQSSLEHL